MDASTRKLTIARIARKAEKCKKNLLNFKQLYHTKQLDEASMNNAKDETASADKICQDTPN